MKEIIKNVIRDVLELDAELVNEDIDLSELGLTSFSLIEIIVRIEDELDVELDDDDLLLDRLNTLSKIETCIQKVYKSKK